MKMDSAASAREPEARPSAKSDLGAAPVRDGERWLQAVGQGRDDIARALLRACRDHVERAAGEQLAPDGEAYTHRAFAVAQILHDLDVDAETVVAGAVAELRDLSDLAELDAPRPGIEPRGAPD